MKIFMNHSNSIKLSTAKQKILEDVILEVEKYIVDKDNNIVKSFLTYIKEITFSYLKDERKILSAKDILPELEINDFFRKNCLTKEEINICIKNFNNIINQKGFFVQNFLKGLYKVEKKLQRELTSYENNIIINNLDSILGFISFASKPIKIFTKQELGTDDVEILFDGYFYRFGSNKNYFAPYIDIHIKNSKRSILETVDIKNKTLQKIRRLSSYKNPIEMFVKNKLHNGVDFSPEYQRDLVWEQEDKEKLIDSIFKGLSIGTILLYIREWEEYGEQGLPQYEIIDGKQRLSTILDFYYGKFPYKGKFYYEFNKEEEYIFNEYMINISEINGPLTLREKVEIFLAINTTGKSVSKEVLDNAKKIGGI